MLKKVKISLPQAIVAAVAIASVAAVYIFAPEGRDTIETSIGYVWAAVATFLPSLLGKHKHGGESKGGES